eukprot:Rmarinus@m.21836
MPLRDRMAGIFILTFAILCLRAVEGDVLQLCEGTATSSDIAFLRDSLYSPHIATSDNSLALCNSLLLESGHVPGEAGFYCGYIFGVHGSLIEAQNCLYKFIACMDLGYLPHAYDQRTAAANVMERVFGLASQQMSLIVEEWDGTLFGRNTSLMLGVRPKKLPDLDLDSFFDIRNREFPSSELPSMVHFSFPETAALDIIPTHPVRGATLIVVAHVPRSTDGARFQSFVAYAYDESSGIQYKHLNHRSRENTQLGFALSAVPLPVLPAEDRENMLGVTLSATCANENIKRLYVDPMTLNPSFVFTYDTQPLASIVKTKSKQREWEGVLCDGFLDESAAVFSGQVVVGPGEVVCVPSAVTVPAGTRLTILYNTTLVLHSSASIDIFGEFVSLGTSDYPVLLSSLTSEPPSPWGGVNCAGTRCVFVHTWLAGAGRAHTATISHKRGAIAFLGGGVVQEGSNAPALKSQGKSPATVEKAVFHVTGLNGCRGIALTGGAALRVKDVTFSLSGCGSASDAAVSYVAGSEVVGSSVYLPLAHADEAVRRVQVSVLDCAVLASGADHGTSAIRIVREPSASAKRNTSHADSNAMVDFFGDMGMDVLIQRVHVSGFSNVLYTSAEGGEPFLRASVSDVTCRACDDLVYGADVYEYVAHGWCYVAGARTFVKDVLSSSEGRPYTFSVLCSAEEETAPDTCVASNESSGGLGGQLVGSCPSILLHGKIGPTLPHEEQRACKDIEPLRVVNRGSNTDNYVGRYKGMDVMLVHRREVDTVVFPEVMTVLDEQLYHSPIAVCVVCQPYPPAPAEISTTPPMERIRGPAVGEYWAVYPLTVTTTLREATFLTKNAHVIPPPTATLGWWLIHHAEIDNFDNAMVYATMWLQAVSMLRRDSLLGPIRHNAISLDTLLLARTSYPQDKLSSEHVPTISQPDLSQRAEVFVNRIEPRLGGVEDEVVPYLLGDRKNKRPSPECTSTSCDSMACREIKAFGEVPEDVFSLGLSLGAMFTQKLPMTCTWHSGDKLVDHFRELLPTSAAKVVLPLINSADVDSLTAAQEHAIATSVARLREAIVAVRNWDKSRAVLQYVSLCSAIRRLGIPFEGINVPGVSKELLACLSNAGLMLNLETQESYLAQTSRFLHVLGDFFVLRGILRGHNGFSRLSLEDTTTAAWLCTQRPANCELFRRIPPLNTPLHKALPELRANLSTSQVRHVSQDFGDISTLPPQGLLLPVPMPAAHHSIFTYQSLLNTAVVSAKITGRTLCIPPDWVAQDNVTRVSAQDVIFLGPGALSWDSCVSVCGGELDLFLRGRMTTPDGSRGSLPNGLTRVRDINLVNPRRADVSEFRNRLHAAEGLRCVGVGVALQPIGFFAASLTIPAGGRVPSPVVRKLAQRVTADLFGGRPYVAVSWHEEPRVCEKGGNDVVGNGTICLPAPEAFDDLLSHKVKGYLVHPQYIHSALEGLQAEIPGVSIFVSSEGVSRGWDTSEAVLGAPDVGVRGWVPGGTGGRQHPQTPLGKTLRDVSFDLSQMLRDVGVAQTEAEIEIWKKLIETEIAVSAVHFSHSMSEQDLAIYTWRARQQCSFFHSRVCEADAVCSKFTRRLLIKTLPCPWDNLSPIPQRCTMVRPRSIDF